METRGYKPILPYKNPKDMALLRKLQCSGGTSDMAECGTAQQPSDTGRQLRNRWTSAQGLVGPGGRSGALSVSLRAALKVRGRRLNEVETWAVLCQAAQSLQDLLLQQQGRTSLASLEFLLVSPDSLRLTQEGRVEVERTRGSQLAALLHPEIGGLGRLSPAEVERLSVHSLGRTVREASARTIRSLQPLVSSMCSSSLGAVPGLLRVLGEVERHWRDQVGPSPPSQLVSQLCHLTLGRTAAPPQVKPASTQFNQLNCSSSSDSTDDLHSTSSASLPKPPPGLPGLQGLASPLRNSLPSLLEPEDTGRRMFTQHRKYGKRLEFKPVVTQRLERQRGREEMEALERTRSHSANSLPGLRSLNKQNTSKRSLANARRLYREVAGSVVGPEFVVRSSAAAVRADLTSGSSRGTTVLLVLLTGHKLEVRLEHATTTVQHLQDVAMTHLCLGQDAARLGLMLNSCGEWLYLAPDTRLARIVPGGRGREGQTSLTLHHRFLLLPAALEELHSPASRHLLYLQLRQDCIEGLHRADVSLHLSLAALALRAELGPWTEKEHGAGPYFMPQHYLPDQVRTLLGERGARLATEKLHQGIVNGGESLKESYCQQVMGLKDYGFFFYTGRQGKKPESASRFFAIHANGIFFFEISRNVFKPPKEIEKYNWRDIKEIQAGQTKIQFLLHMEAGSQRIKIYLDENKSKHVFDIAETYHKQHMARMQSSLSDAGQLPKQGKNEALNDVFRTFCRKVKRYTRESGGASKMSRKRLSLPLAGRSGVKRSTSTAGQEGGAEARYSIRRLTHYTSMATMAGPCQEVPGAQEKHLQEIHLQGIHLQGQHPQGQQPQKKHLQESPVHQRLDSPQLQDGQDKYRYKLYLENEDDEVGAVMETGSVEEEEEEEKENEEPAMSRMRLSSVRMGTRLLAGGRGQEGAKVLGRGQEGTKVLVRGQEGVVPPPHLAKEESGLHLPGLVDVSLRPTIWGEPLPQVREPGMDESLSMSLLERFDQMDTEAGEPERRIGTVIMERDPGGRLGVKIGGTPSGVYVDKIDWGVARLLQGSLQEGDRVIAVDGQSLESLGYTAALDILRGAGQLIELLVSQLR